MKLTFRKHEVKDLSQLQELVAENAEAVEAGFRVLSTTANFGRSTVELVGLDRHKTPALIALSFTGDDATLFRMVEAYAWTLEYPESVRRLMPAGDGAHGWPPRVVFIAERLPESFLRKIRLLAFPAVNCFEYRCVEVNNATGFYLDPVDWTASEPARAVPSAPPPVAPGHLDVFRRHVPPSAPDPAAEHAEHRAVEHAEPAARRVEHAPAEHTPQSRWFGLLTSPGATPPPERAPGRAESQESIAASIMPIAEDPTVTHPPREVVSQPTAAHDGDLGDDHELTPAWRKLLEKLAGTFDTRLVEEVPAPAKPASLTAGSEKEPASAHARPSRNGGAGRYDDAMQRALLDVVKLPPNGELVPQWRKFFEKTPLDEAQIGKVLEKPALDQAQIAKVLEKPALEDARIGKFLDKPALDDARIGKVLEKPALEEARIGKFLDKPALDDARIGKFLDKPALEEARIGKFLDKPALDEAQIGRFPEKPRLNDQDAKIAAVRDYLHHEFPMCTIYDFFDYQQNAQVLQVQDAQGKVCHSALVAFEFFDAHHDSEIRGVLDQLRLPHAMRQAGQAAVVVTPDGLEVQKG